MKVVYKPCRKKDLLPAFRMLRHSFNHLRRDTGKRPLLFRIRRNKEIEHLHRQDKVTFRCAWAGKNIVGFAAALIRGQQWYLAFLFVHPRYQDKGVGKELLGRVWRNRPGMSHSLSTFTYNMQAVGIYSKFGMAPICTFPMLEIELKKPGDLKPSGLECKTNLSRQDLAWIIRLDAKIRGYAHPQEWRFWLKFDDTQIYLFKNKGVRVGYSMVYNWGGIAPAGAISNSYLTKVIAETIRMAKIKKKTLRICCPAGNLSLYRYLIRSGFRLLEMDLFMSDRPYADFQRYVPAQLAVF
jgi:ribosomal protein S18 acetylase RimI-like enzyme